MTYNFVTREEIDRALRPGGILNVEFLYRLLSERDAYRKGWKMDRYTKDKLNGQPMPLETYDFSIDAEAARMLEKGK